VLTWDEKGCVGCVDVGGRAWKACGRHGGDVSVCYGYLEGKVG